MGQTPKLCKRMQRNYPNALFSISVLAIWFASGYLSQNKCIICLHDIKCKAQRTFTKCQPVPHGPYHKKCLLKWIRNGCKSCPYCRQKIVVVDYQSRGQKLQRAVEILKSRMISIVLDATNIVVIAIAFI